MILMKYHALFVIFDQQQNLKSLSAANYTWRFMGYNITIFFPVWLTSTFFVILWCNRKEATNFLYFAIE